MGERRRQNAIQSDGESAERALRLEQRAAEARQRRLHENAKVKMELRKAEVGLRKDVLLFRGMLGAGVAICVLCVWTILREGAPPHAVNWAVATLTSLATGITGYLTGRNSRRD
jgi:hypothetical protein